MRHGSILAIALAGSCILSPAVLAQNPYTPLGSTPRQDTARSYKYAISPDAGPWLICVQVFKGERAKDLAEAMAEYIMREYKAPAYLYEGNRKEREEESKRVAALRQQYDEFVKAMKKANPDAAAAGFRTTTMQFQDEFGVFMSHPRGILEDMDAAREFLNAVRKFKAPPDEYCTRMMQVRPAPGQEGGFVDRACLNPFETAFVAPNVTIPRPKPTAADIYPVLERLNSAEPLNVLKCSKPYTLVVRIYQGSPTTVVDRNGDGTAIGKIGSGQKQGEALNASAMQAHSLAEYLRKMKPNAYESYVLHTQYYSLVTVGQFASADDPQLKATQSALKGMKLQTAPTGGTVLDSLMPEPTLMLIPRPKK